MPKQFTINGHVISLGAIKDKDDRRDYQVADIMGAAEDVYIPDEFEVAPITKIKYQNGYPSCVGQATSAAKEPDEGVELSARGVYIKCKERDGNTNWGTSLRCAQLVSINPGIPEEKLLPEDHTGGVEKYLNLDYYTDTVKANAIQHANQSVYSVGKKWLGDHYDYFEDVIKAIWQFKKRVITGCDWYESYDNMQSSNFILKNPTGVLRGGHCFYSNGVKKINGERHIIFVNSFGDWWGDKGKFYANKEWFNKYAYNGWLHIDLPKKLPIDLRYYPIDRTNYNPDNTGWRPWNKYLLEKAMLAYWTTKLGHFPTVREINGSVYGLWDKEALWSNRVGDAWLYCQKPSYDKWNKEGILENKLAEIKIKCQNSNWDGKI
jgi:hypothetical protein